MKKILIRGFLALVAAIGGAAAYLTVANVNVTVTASGCGTIEPPTMFSIAWHGTSTGGTATVPPLTVHVDTAPQNGQEAITVTAPAGLKMPVTIGSNVMLVSFDGTPLFQRVPLERQSMTVDLGKMRQHHLVVNCR